MKKNFSSPRGSELRARSMNGMLDFRYVPTTSVGSTTAAAL